MIAFLYTIQQIINLIFFIQPCIKFDFLTVSNLPVINLVGRYKHKKIQRIEILGRVRVIIHVKMDKN